MIDNNITKIVKNNMCIGCNVCEIVCPKQCIHGSLDSKGMCVPSVMNEQCVECKECLRVCPGAKHYSFNEVMTFSKDAKGYSAWSLDNEKRYNGTSGGVIGSIIDYLIKSNVYDEAFVIDTYRIDDIYETKLYSKVIDKICIQKSRYVPISHKNAAEYIANNSNMRVIFVATPCCVYALKSFIERKKLNTDNYLFLGLYCDGVMSYNYFDYFKKYFAKGSVIDEFFFRDKEDKGWPGNVAFKSVKGEKTIVNRNERTEVKRFFALKRCLNCTDKLNHLSDISIGDDYIKGEESKVGKNSVIVLTAKGNEIWNMVSGIIEREEREIEQIKKSQKVSLKNKKTIKYTILLGLTKLGENENYFCIYLLSRIIQLIKKIRYIH